MNKDLSVDALKQIILGEGLLNETLERNLKYAKENCPIKTGNLINSIQGVVDFGDLKITVGSDEPYAKYVEYGVRSWERSQGGPHNPKKPKTSWEAKRKYGKNPNAIMPFLRPAVFKTQSEIQELVPKEIKMDVKIIIK